MPADAGPGAGHPHGEAPPGHGDGAGPHRPRVREAGPLGEDEDRGGADLDALLQRQEVRLRGEAGAHGRRPHRHAAPACGVDGGRGAPQRHHGRGGRGRRGVDLLEGVFRESCGVEGLRDVPYDESGQ